MRDTNSRVIETGLGFFDPGGDHLIARMAMLDLFLCHNCGSLSWQKILFHVAFIAGKGALSGVGLARRVSPELRAPIPAALCHGARGPERRRACLGPNHDPSPPL